jgi:hypothetical protein
MYSKYTATAIAKVWGGRAFLPDTSRMWEWFWNAVKERGGLKKGYQWFNADMNQSKSS